MNPRKLEGWESVTILYKQCNLAVKASWKYSCIRKLLHHRSVSRTTLQHRIFHLVSFLYRFMNPTCGHFKTMPPRCPDTQDLHINVPPGPFNSAEKGHNLGFVPGLSAPWSGSRVMQPLFTLPSPGNIFVAQDSKAGGGGGEGRGPKTVREPGSRWRDDALHQPIRSPSSSETSEGIGTATIPQLIHLKQATS